MSKRYKTNKFEELIVNLDTVAKQDEQPYKSDAIQIIGYYYRNGWLPSPMKSSAERIVRANKYLIKPEFKHRERAKHYLYAISASDCLKVGFSINVKERLRSLQTSHPDKLKLEWSIFAGYTVKEASKQEHKLHRRIRKHHIRGEWFRLDALPIIKDWRVKKPLSRQDRIGIEENKKLDREFIAIMGD